MKAFVVLLVLALVVGGVVVGFIGFQNDNNNDEIGIKAQDEKAQTVYDNGYKKVLEVSQVPAMATDQLKELYDSAMTGRYGEDGSKALLQFIKEQNPQVDAVLYRQVQQTIEAFRNEFTQEMKDLVSRKQKYETRLHATTSGRLYNWLAEIFGKPYPHIDLSKYKVITSDRTDKTFEKRKDEPLDLRQKK